MLHFQTQIFSKLVDNIDDMDPPQIATGGSSNGLWSQRTESVSTTYIGI